MQTLTFTVTTDLNHDQRMIRICTSLCEAGYDILLVGRKMPISQPLNNQVFRQKRLNCFFQKGKFFYIEYNIRLFFFLLFQKFDVLTAIDLDTIAPCYFVAKIKGKKIGYDAHEYFTEVPEVVNRPMTKKIWEAVADFFIPRMDFCYTVGESLADIFSKRYHVDFQVIRNIANFTEFDSDKALNSVSDKVKISDLKIILYQGALNKGRCIEQYIEAMQFIEGAELHLAGDGDLTQKLKELANHFNVSHKVKFLGKLSPKALTEVTQQAYIGLNLLENTGLSYYYSLANKTFDYIQAEVPALHPDFPEYQAIVKNYKIGLLLSNNQVTNIVNFINLLLANNEHYNCLKMQCLLAKSVYTWDKEAENLIKIYKLLLF